MSKTRISFIAGAIFLLATGAAQASPITFSDVFNPTDVFFDGQESTACIGANGATDTTSASTCKSLTWTHTLPGYNSITDTLTIGTLTLTVYNNSTDNNQNFSLLVDLLPSFPGSVSDGSTIGSPDTPGFTVLSQLADGSVNVTLTSQNGNHTFFFGQSQLYAAGDSVPVVQGPADPLSSVPEPGSMLLLGTGLAAWAGRRLRRKNT